MEPFLVIASAVFQDLARQWCDASKIVHELVPYEEPVILGETLLP